MEHKRYKLTISGKVEGVGYRQFTRQQAFRLGLTGWVRNEHNGDVQAEVQGISSQLEELLAACKQGPPWSRVDAVKQEEIGTLENESGFVITYV
ncbi:MAG: acylphosphatase [Bacteroidota bacterium]